MWRHFDDYMGKYPDLNAQELMISSAQNKIK